MEIRIQSIKFDADKKLLEFINKKLEKLPKFFDNIVATEVTLSLLSDHENKNVKVRVVAAGGDVIVERNGKSFETAINECADILKDQLKKKKELLQS